MAIKNRKKKIMKREDKVRRVSLAIENMKPGEIISPSKLFRSIKMHPNTGKDILDMYDSLKEISFKVQRDETKKIRGIMRTDDDLEIRRDIREIKQSLLNIERQLEKR